MHHLSLRVTDTATNLATPCRIHIRDEAGRYYPPYGHAAEFPVLRHEDVGAGVRQQQLNYATIDGACEIPLPTGVPLHIVVSKGLTHQPISQVVTLGAGQLTLRLCLSPWTPGKSVVHADSRCHFLTPHTARLEGAAEGLDYVNLLAIMQEIPSIDGVMYKSFNNIHAFSGQAETFGRERGGVYVNTFNRHPMLGRLGLLNCHRVVYPLAFGTYDETDDWSLGDWVGQCHRKGGLVVWADPYRQEHGLLGGEALVQAILGDLDALEIDGLPRQTPILPILYRLFQAGICLPLVGGSGKDSNKYPLGCVRTITPKIADEIPTYAEWIAQVKRGETQVTNGPIISWTINGQAPTRMMDFPGPGRLVVNARAESLVPFEAIELVANGTVVARGSTELSAEIELTQGQWLTVRCRGHLPSSLYPQMPVFAHTSPVVVRVNGQLPPKDPAAVNVLLKQLATTRDWVENVGRFSQPIFQKEILRELTLATERLQQP